MAGTQDPSPAGPPPGYRPELATEPAGDERWTSDRELDRLAALATSLHHWSPVYERWRGHPLATARPPQPGFDRGDLAAIDDLRGVHLGRFAAASRRLRTVGGVLSRIAESTTAARSALAGAWRDGAAQRALPRFDEIQRGAQDCAALCERLGLHLQSAIVDTVAPVLTSAVDEILARSRRWELTVARTSQEVWERRIAGLDAARAAGPSSLAPWRAELDALVVEYDAVIGLLRATLSAAASTIAQVYQVLHREIGSRPEPASSGTPAAGGAGPAAGQDRSASTGAAGGSSRNDEPAPASTALTSAGQADAGHPVAASSSAGGGGGAGVDGGVGGGFGGAGSGGGGFGGDGSATGAGAAGAHGSALLGQLSAPPPAGCGDATLASASSSDPGYGAGQATAGAGGSGPAPIPGTLTSGAEDQQRTGRAWGSAANEDRAREASWARLRALLGDDAGARHGPGRAGR